MGDQNRHCDEKENTSDYRFAGKSGSLSVRIFIEV